MSEIKTMSTIKIESGYEIPRGGGGEAGKFPFAKLEPGQSFFVPQGNYSPTTLIGYAARANKNFKPKRFAGRSVTENGVKGRRFWRTS